MLRRYQQGIWEVFVWHESERAICVLHVNKWCRPEEGSDSSQDRYRLTTGLGDRQESLLGRGVIDLEMDNSLCMCVCVHVRACVCVCVCVCVIGFTLFFCLDVSTSLTKKLLVWHISHKRLNPSQRDLREKLTVALVFLKFLPFTTGVPKFSISKFSEP
jgi:hypothetical protein